MNAIEDSDEELEYQEFSAGKEGIVFLIDATESMFDCQQFSLAIKCVENVMKNKAIATPEDQLAVILFGTDKASNDESFERIFIVQNLQKTSVQSILQIKDLNECDFDAKFGHNKQFSLAEVFSLAIKEFTQRKVNFASKRVILFTSTSDPYSGDSKEAQQMREIAVIRAKTFDNYNIAFDLIPLNSKDNKLFDVDIFYGEAFPHLKDDKCDTLLKLEPLLSRIYNRFHKQRSLASIPFRLGSVGSTNTEDRPEVNITINVYNLYSVTKKPTSVVINRNDLKEVKSETIFLTQEEVISKQEMSKNYRFGNESIVLTKEDEKKLKDFEEPALTLLGFKPRTALMVYMHIKPGHFIFPDESIIKGSTTLFSALLKRCVERDRIPICRFTLKKEPRLVALYPQIESKTLGKSAGFHVVYLPFKDDVRDLDIKSAEQLPVRPEASDLAKRVVNNLSFNYNPKNFPNPVLQNHWRTIEGLALKETIEPFDDSQTQPNYEDIEEKAGYDMYCLNQMLDAYAVQPIQKKVKVYEDLSEFVNKNQLGILTVPELKEFCKQKNIDCGSRKAEVIEAIRSYYNSKK